MLDPNTSPPSGMTAYSPISADRTKPSPGSFQANTTPHFESDLDQLGQHFLLVADAVGKFSTALQRVLNGLAP